MALLAARLLGGFAAALISALTAACPGESTATTEVANQNVATAGVQSNFRAVNLSSQTHSYILEVAKANSIRKNIVIAWGGTESLRDQTQMALEDLSRDNPSLQIVMIEGPELNGFINDLELDFLPLGSSTLSRTSQGLGNVERGRQDIYNFAKAKFIEPRK